MMKEYGEIENDLKLVQSICKNKEEKYLLKSKFYLCSGPGLQTEVSTQRVGRVSQVSAGESEQTGV